MTKVSVEQPWQHRVCQKKARIDTHEGGAAPPWYFDSSDLMQTRPHTARDSFALKIWFRFFCKWAWGHFIRGVTKEKKNLENIKAFFYHYFLC